MSLSVTKPEGKYTGTAFLIDKAGIAATAWHVVDHATAVTAKFSDGQEFDASGVIDKDEKRDVALIRVKVAGRPVLDVATAEPPVGAKAYVIGSPEGLDFSITEGLVSQIRDIDQRKVIQFSCPASPGNSGGPLVDQDGKVLGVVSFQLVEGQNLNFAVPGVILAGLDNTLPTSPWGSVKSSSSSSAKVFSRDRYGSPVWDGTLLDYRGSPYNWWRAGLLYKDDAPVSADNAALGLMSFYAGSSGKYDARAIPLEEAGRLYNIIRGFADTGKIVGLPKGKGFQFKGERFVKDGMLFSDKPLIVGYDGGRHKKLVFYFEPNMPRDVDQTNAKALADAMLLWFQMLADDGLKVNIQAGN